MEPQVSQANTPRTSSPGPAGTNRLGEMVSPKVAAKAPNGTAWSTPVKVIAPATAKRRKSALKMMSTSAVPSGGAISFQISTRESSPPPPW